MCRSRFEFTVKHVNGDENLYVDVFMRWAKEHESRKAMCRNVCVLS